MSRTTKTEATFKRDLQAVDDLAAGFWVNDYIERQREATLARHAAYDGAYNRMVREIAGMEANSRYYACTLLRRLGDVGCRSGTLEFSQTREALERMGVSSANHVFEHDRWEIAATYLPEKTRSTA